MMVIFFVSLYILGLNCGCLECITLSRKLAYDHCADQGGEITYEDLYNNSFAPTALALLAEDQSMWLYDAVHYSEFVAWKWCFKTTYGEKKVFKNISNSIYNCTDLCRDSSTSFIGLRYHDCLCFEQNTNWDNLSSDKNCKPWDNSMNNQNISNLHVFEVIKTGHLFESNATKTLFRQCVAANKFDKKPEGDQHIKVNYSTYLCNNPCQQNVNGYLCQSGQTQGINATCQNSTDHCVKESRLSWNEAIRDCHQHNGRLESIIMNDNVIKDMKPNHTYWTAIFRDYIKVAYAPESQKGHACLSVRKLKHNEWIFEPDDCSLEKVTLCKNIYLNSDSKSHVNHTTNSSVETEAKIPVLTVTLPMAILILIGIIISVCLLYRKTAAPRHERGSVSERSEENQFDKHRSSCSAYMKPAESYIEDTEIKPVGTTETASNISLEHDYDTVSCNASEDLNNATKDICEDVYDKTNHKSADSMHVFVDKNIYSHMGKTGIDGLNDEIYDTTLTDKREDSRNVYSQDYHILETNGNESVYDKTEKKRENPQNVYNQADHASVANGNESVNDKTEK